MAMQAHTKISERRACRLVGISRTVLHYQPAESAERRRRKREPLSLPTAPNEVRSMDI